MTAILFLHGGGHADHTRYINLINRFAKDGILSSAFDHRAPSLSGRLKEAEQELSKFESTHNLSDQNVVIWGSSMGGHVACRLIERHPKIKAVVLQSAAAYSENAETIPFGPEFTHELQRNNSWTNSPAFTAIDKYRGPVLNMYGQFDDVVPHGVQKRYRERAEKNGEFHILQGSAHPQLAPRTPQEHKAWDQMYQYALTFIKNLE